MNDKSPFLPLNPDQASTAGVPLDTLMWALHLLTIIITAGVMIAVILFAIKYRRGSKVDRANPPLEHLTLELTWTILPFIISMGIFAWGAIVYFQNVRERAGSMEIYVTGKQWMWKVQHPNGKWEQNELHVPMGRPVKLTMTSEDVLHDFFIPAFRIKMDVIPGRYTNLHFEATQPGRYHLFCAEYCGTYHSGMVGSVVVMTPADYEKWLRTGNVQNTRAAAGSRLFRQHGCSGCHGPNSSVKAPLLEGIYGSQRALENGKFVVADDRYLHDSILLPQKEIRAGFKPIMPTYKGRISEGEIMQIIDYLKTTDTANQSVNGSSNPYGNGTLGRDASTARSGVIEGSMERTVVGDTINSSSPGSPRNQDVQLGGQPRTSTGSMESTATGMPQNSSTPQSQRNPRGEVERMTR
ncbi:MAG TPA: cytochrome c oxidase subunit II [Abditibacteriaceae bacterium]|jgi:cytochrome c oxidase subunit 2